MTEDLIREIIKSKSRIVAIDGYKGTGKTTLSNNLAKIMGIQVLHLDEHRHGMAYLENEVHKNIVDCKKVLVEGIESIRICQKYESVFNVYVKKPSYCQSASTREVMSLGEENNWSKRPMLEYINKEKKMYPKELFPHLGLEFDEQCIIYLTDYRPFEKADFIFEE